MPHQSESRVRRIVERVAADAAACRLDRFVRELLEKNGLPDPSNAFVRRLIVAGAVRVNGRAIRRPAFALASRSQVEVFIDPARIDAGRGAAAAPGRVEVLYQDADLIAVAKPPGLATHPGADTRRASLVTLVQAWLTSKGAGTAPYLGVHQRLDRDTSGVLLFTLSERANPALAQSFRERGIEKVYHAICARTRDVRLVPGKSLHISGSLALQGTGRTSRMMPSADGVNAETDVRIVEHLGLAILVEARPRTGRRHQIRAQLAAEHLPIIGDDRYGQRRAWPCPVSRMMLHASSIALRHPVTGAALRIECPWPADFGETLDCFRRRGRD